MLSLKQSASIRSASSADWNVAATSTASAAASVDDGYDNNEDNSENGNDNLDDDDISEHRRQWFRRHDSTFSVSDEYQYYNHQQQQTQQQQPRSDTTRHSSSSSSYHLPNLNVWQGAALLTADNMGTGLLALPHDVTVLGLGFGLGFLIANLPINLYAGTILCHSASYVEEQQQQQQPQQQDSTENSNGNSGPTHQHHHYYHDQQQYRPHSMFEQPATLKSYDELSDEDNDDDGNGEDTKLLQPPKKNDKDDVGGVGYASISPKASDVMSDLDDASGSSGERHHNDDDVPYEDDGGEDDLTEIGEDDDDPMVSKNDDRNAVVPRGGGRSVHHDTATFDFIGMTSALFSHQRNSSMSPLSSPTSLRHRRKHPQQQQQQQQPQNHRHRQRQHHEHDIGHIAYRRGQDPTFWVMILFYTNIFLVLGNYIVVMAHAVSALIGEDILCIPTAGLIASTLMFAVSQLRTMARLGRAASIVSLTALAVVVGQCLYYCRLAVSQQQDAEDDHNDIEDDLMTRHRQLEDDYQPLDGVVDDGSISTTVTLAASILLKFSAMGSVGFAVGSQKLLLNIRHEFQRRSEAPQSLALSLLVFGGCYVFIIVMAGPNPPGFLFDAIPEGTIDRRIAGFLLWIHVVVSYAINSQAICSSMDRIFFYDWVAIKDWSEQRRWMMITGITSASAFFVANAIPFFKDLVAFIGALTSVPLTLLLPALYIRQVHGLPVWLPSLQWTWKNIGSYLLLVYSSVFMVTALAGSIYSILSDWQNHTGGFFSCH